MKAEVYRQYMLQFIRQAIHESDGSNSGIATALLERNIPTKGVRSWFLKDAEEQIRALNDARKAFDEHRHWPRSLVLSHLGLDPELK